MIYRWIKMRLFRLVRYYSEAIKAIFRIILFLAKKCLKELICVLLLIIIFYLIFNALIAFIVSILGILCLFSIYLLINLMIDSIIKSIINIKNSLEFIIN